jgi:hypothetical protein
MTSKKNSWRPTLPNIPPRLSASNSKTVQDFYNRVSDTFRNAYQTKPDHTTTYVGTMHDGITQAHADEIMLQGVTQMQLLMLNTMFLGGLKEEIRNRVLEGGPTHPDNSVEAAREIESILNDKRRDQGVVITSIEDGDPEDGFDVGEVDEEEANHLNAVNTVLRCKGQPQYRFQTRPRGGSQRGSDGIGLRYGFNRTGAIVCFFCNKPGHQIAQCHARAASGQGHDGSQGRHVATVENPAPKVGPTTQDTLNF